MTEKTSSDWCALSKLSAPGLRMPMIIIQVDRRSRWSKWTLSRVICQASVALATCCRVLRLISQPGPAPGFRVYQEVSFMTIFTSESKSMWHNFVAHSCPSRYTVIV